VKNDQPNILEGTIENGAILARTVFSTISTVHLRQKFLHAESEWSRVKSRVNST
jgi:hypothetical protein